MSDNPYDPPRTDQHYANDADVTVRRGLCVFLVLVCCLQSVAFMVSLKDVLQGSATWQDWVVLGGAPAILCATLIIICCAIRE